MASGNWLPKSFESLRNYSAQKFTADLIAGITVGFANGIAVIIASTQIKDFLGIHADKVPGEFLGRLEVLGRNFCTVSRLETTLGLVSLALMRAHINSRRDSSGLGSALRMTRSEQSAPFAENLKGWHPARET